MKHSRLLDFQCHPKSGSRWGDDLSPLLGLFSNVNARPSYVSSLLFLLSISLYSFLHARTYSAVEDDGPIDLVIDEWAGKCTVRLWKSRPSNNYHMARRLGAQWTIRLTSTMVHWQTFTRNGFKWEMVMCQIPLSLPAEVDADKHKDCDCDMLANQSRRSKLSRLHR